MNEISSSLAALSDGLVPGMIEVVGPYGIAAMVYNHAVALVNASYDRNTKTFAMTPEIALVEASRLFQLAFDGMHVERRLKQAASHVGARDTYASMVFAYRGAEADRLLVQSGGV